MNLLQLLTRGAPIESRGWNDLLEILNFGGRTYPLWGLQQTLSGTKEEIEQTFAGMVQGAYKSNGIVFACMLVRLLLFSEARFQYRRLRAGRPGALWGDQSLAILEHPWSGAATGDLLARILQQSDIAGSAFVVRRPARLRVPRPDWMTIILGSDSDPDVEGGDIDADPIGYLYHPGGHLSGRKPMAFLPEEVAHYAPIPDPLASYRGMSWLTPILREISADGAATDHKWQFFTHGATPNMVVSLDPGLTKDAYNEWMDLFEKKYGGGLKNAYKTMYLAAGAKAEVVGANLRQIDFKVTQGAGETRIAAAAGVPPIIAGLSEGLQAATYCLPASESVWTLDGPRPIASIRPGDDVWATADKSIRSGRVIWQGPVGEKLVYRIRTKNRILRATDNHPVLARVPGRNDCANADRTASVEWRSVADLRPGDRVVEVTQLPDTGGTMPAGVSSDLVRWLGAYMGDGSGVGKDRSAIRLAIPPADRVRDYYEHLTDKVFGLRIGHEPRGFRIQNLATSRLLAELGFAGIATTKMIPGWIFRLPAELRLQFLAGLIDTDGTVDRRGVGTLGFANRALVDQARALFVSCGVQTSNVYYREQMESGLPQPGLHESYDFWSFAITTGLASVPTADPLYRQRLGERRDYPEGLDAEHIGLDGLGFFTIRSIEPESIQPVYDLTIAGDHSFIANGIAVHNSNYGQARRRFADGTIRPLWRNLCGSLERIIPPPSGSQLWYDDRDIPFLQEDMKDRAEIQQVQAGAIRSLTDAGFKPESVIDAVEADDFSLLEHTGLYSVQLQPPGTTKPEPPQLPPGTKPPLLPAKAGRAELLAPLLSKET